MGASGRNAERAATVTAAFARLTARLATPFLRSAGLLLRGAGGLSGATLRLAAYSRRLGTLLDALVGIFMRVGAHKHYRVPLYPVEEILSQRHPYLGSNLPAGYCVSNNGGGTHYGGRLEASKAGATTHHPVCENFQRRGCPDPACIARPRACSSKLRVGRRQAKFDRNRSQTEQS